MNPTQALPFSSDPILVVDKRNLLGSWLYPFLSHDSLTVLVSSITLSDTALVHIPYGNKMPKIPNTRYDSMYFVWSGEKAELAVLPEFMGKAQRDNTNFIFITSYTTYVPSTVQTILTQHKRSYVFVLGDLFGEHPLAHSSRVTSLLSEAKRTNTIYLSQMGLLRIYPVTYEDSAKTIVQTVTSGALYAQPLLVFPKLPITELVFARTLQKVDPTLRIDFQEQKHTPSSTAFLQNGKYLLEDIYPLQEKLLLVWKKSAIPWLRSTRKVIRPKKVVSQSQPIGTVSKTFIVSLFYLMILLLFMPFLGTVGFSALGTQALLGAKAVSGQGSALSAMQLAQLAQVSYAFSDSFGSLLFIESKLVYKDADTAVLLEQIHSESRMSQAILDAIDGQVSFSKLLSGSATDPQATLLRGINALKNSIFEVQAVKESGYVPSVFASDLEKLQPVIDSFSTVLDTLPSVLGMQTQKRYLVLIDNALQLRPGGGVVSAYGVLTISKGKISAFHLSPIDTVDSKLKGQLAMPFAFDRYGGMTNVTLRNGLYDTDFSRNAATLATVFSQETGIQVDGVITLDTTFLQRMISITGPITVDGGTVSVDNFYSSMQSQPQFLSKFAEVLFATLSSKPSLFLQMSTLTVQLTHEKHLLMAFSDPATQSVFTVGDVSSPLWDGRVNNDTQFNDFLGISETNIGNNNANFFMQRSITQHIMVAPDASYSAQTTILYHNTAQSNASDGNYLLYLRILLPESAQIGGISFDDQAQKIIAAVTDPKEYGKKDFKAKKGIEVDTVTDTGKKIVGFFVPIPAGATKAIRISYTMSTQMPFVQKPGVYSMRLFKQPGMDSIPYSLQISYPASLKIDNTTSGFSSEGTTLSFLDMVTSDTLLNASFSQN